MCEYIKYIAILMHLLYNVHRYNAYRHNLSRTNDSINSFSITLVSQFTATRTLPLLLLL